MVGLKTGLKNLMKSKLEYASEKGGKTLWKVLEAKEISELKTIKHLLC